MCAELTAIAEACLEMHSAIVVLQLAERHGRPPDNARLSVLRSRKLSVGAELGYAADLDVVFVFDGGDENTVDWFSRPRCAQRLLGALRQRTPRGRLYEVDTRLRPSG